MANIDGIGSKFLVLKKEDIDKHLTLPSLTNLYVILQEIDEGRLRENKGINTYLVINTDESYADEVIKLMKENGHWG